MIKSKLDIIKDAADAFPNIIDPLRVSDLKEEDIPNPTLWRLLLLPAMPKTKTKGGIILADETQTAEKYNNSRSLVVGIGPLAYKDVSRFKEHPDAPNCITVCSPGDFVCHGKYAGQKVIIGDIEFIIINDDEITAIVPNPTAISAYV